MMKANGLELAWIIVKDFKQAVKFYTEVVGLKLIEMVEEMGWAELEGHKGGARLGIMQTQPDFKPGQNAFVTFTVDDLEQTIEELKEKGAHCVGQIEEVPGHVKIQMVVDSDGNHFQMVQKLY